jgi:hypothetical protein
MGPTGSQSDRRAAKRLLIERDLQFRELNRREGEPDGLGKTLNISSSGILFTTDQTLLPGRRMELSINWPAHLDDRCALKLVARGRVVRYEGNAAAIEIIQHEFRTRSTRSSPGAETRGAPNES